MAPEYLLDITEVSAKVRFSATWIRTQVKAKAFPQPKQFVTGGRCLTRWRGVEIDEWIRAEFGADAPRTEAHADVTAGRTH